MFDANQRRTVLLRVILHSLSSVMPATHFRAPWSRRVQVVSAAVTLLILAVYFTDDGWGGTAALGVLAFGALFAVRGYSLENSHLLIHRLGWATRISLADLQDVRLAPGATMGSLRMMGIGGLFGYFGWFRNATLGTYRAFGTHEAHTVVLTFDDRRIVVTPASPGDFVETLNDTRSHRV